MSIDSGSEREYKRFGKYILLDHLVDGGMAEIWRSRELAEDASKMVADKIVAIKVIKKKFSKDETFKKMFLDEIKVAFGLIHPNIAQTYNYGERHEKLFTVIEYVHGKNLSDYLKELRKVKRVFPIDIAIHIIAQVCLGLDYAHKFTDKLTGKQLGLIHRDISPHNIMMDYEGIIKVIDFGIAKAETNSEETKEGTIKGKVSYLGPEYLMEDVNLTHVYDQFALGVTLLELLYGKKVFTGANDMEILKKIYECKIPRPSTVIKDFPKELEDIIMKSMERKPEKRYKDMNEFNRALTKYLYKQYPDFSASDVKIFIAEFIQEEIEEQNKKLRGFGSIDVTPYFKDLKAEMDGTLKVEDDDTDTELTTEERKRLIFGSTSVTNLMDKTISPFIEKMRNGKKD